MENLHDFMLLFRMEPLDQQPSQEDINLMQQQWGNFIGGIASQAKLVGTSRFGFDGQLIDRHLNVRPGISITDKQALSGHMIIKAATLNEATEIAKQCPVLQAGGSVEVRTIIPMEL